MDWEMVVLRMRIRGNKYYWRGLFTVAKNIYHVANSIERAYKLTIQEEL